MSRTVRAPEGISVGQLIGKSGSNIKHLQERSGSRIAIEPGLVKIKGSPEATSIALQLWEQQFKSWWASGGHGLDRCRKST